MKRSSSSRLNRSACSSLFEPLESRQLMSGVQISGVSADNRGEVVITLNGAVNSATVNKSSVQAYTAGADKILGNADDTRVPASVRYSTATHRITIEAQVAANDGYRVKLTASRLRDSAGTPIDGEFNGMGIISGNGKAGGNYEFQTKNDKSSTPTVRMSTSAGTITMKVYRGLKPITAGAFLNYVNAGGYDGMFIYRSEPGFVLQGGGLAVTDDNQITSTSGNDQAITNEFTTNGVIHNTAYTLAFTKADNDPNPPGRDFFFNIGDNSSASSNPNNLDVQNGGFAVFATANNPTSITTLNAIASKVTVNFGGELSSAPVNSSYDGSLDPQNDLVVFRRAAVIVNVAPVT